MLEMAQSQFRAVPEYQPILREIGLDAEAVFAHPRIKVWRSIPERENGVLDAQLSDGRKIRLHVKRYHPARGFTTPADDEARGIQALMAEHIPTAPLVGWGKLADGRSFIITEDLAGYQAADKLIESGISFDLLRDPVATLAAKLHRAGLHHRDLYLCHFFARVEGDEVDLKLIDAGRVKRLPSWPFRHRWVVKDLAQLWYSTLKLPVTDHQRESLLARYTIERGLPSPIPLRQSVERKVRWIARHDARLNARQPNRNISIPQK